MIEAVDVRTAPEVIVGWLLERLTYAWGNGDFESVRVGDELIEADEGIGTLCAALAKLKPDTDIDGRFKKLAETILEKLWRLDCGKCSKVAVIRALGDVAKTDECLEQLVSFRTSYWEECYDDGNYPDGARKILEGWWPFEPTRKMIRRLLREMPYERSMSASQGRNKYLPATKLMITFIQEGYRFVKRGEDKHRIIIKHVEELAKIKPGM